ncbi:hypothetical protein K490DRAFT_69184 [Saccharata proteae CBS 121410]|uniref:Uncharacterized protein n=1 Tax=Saccharata proteae CBS 121410 TaxID=1314787 RepID=A0A9P4HLZ5_9PEZI|nr:hypothetical protein K490DRAFT_69184 [Saccharata proteae CBS 121410]
MPPKRKPAGKAPSTGAASTRQNKPRACKKPVTSEAAAPEMTVTDGAPQLTEDSEPRRSKRKANEDVVPGDDLPVKKKAATAASKAAAKRQNNTAQGSTDHEQSSKVDKSGEENLAAEGNDEQGADDQFCFNVDAGLKKTATATRKARAGVGKAPPKARKNAVSLADGEQTGEINKDEPSLDEKSSVHKKSTAATKNDTAKEAKAPKKPRKIATKKDTVERFGQNKGDGDNAMDLEKVGAEAQVVQDEPAVQSTTKAKTTEEPSAQGPKKPSKLQQTLDGLPPDAHNASKKFKSASDESIVGPDDSNTENTPPDSSPEGTISSLVTANGEAKGNISGLREANAKSSTAMTARMGNKTAAEESVKNDEPKTKDLPESEAAKVGKPTSEEPPQKPKTSGKRTKAQRGAAEEDVHEPPKNSRKRKATASNVDDEARGSKTRAVAFKDKAGEETAAPFPIAEEARPVVERSSSVVTDSSDMAVNTDEIVTETVENGFRVMTYNMPDFIPVETQVPPKEAEVSFFLGPERVKGFLPGSVLQSSGLLRKQLAENENNLFISLPTATPASFIDYSFWKVSSYGLLDAQDKRWNPTRLVDMFRLSVLLEDVAFGDAVITTLAKVVDIMTQNESDGREWLDATEYKKVFDEVSNKHAGKDLLIDVFARSSGINEALSTEPVARWGTEFVKALNNSRYSKYGSLDGISEGLSWPTLENAEDLDWPAPWAGTDIDICEAYHHHNELGMPCAHGKNLQNKRNGLPEPEQDDPVYLCPMHGLVNKKATTSTDEDEDSEMSDTESSDEDEGLGNGPSEAQIQHPLKAARQRAWARRNYPDSSSSESGCDSSDSNSSSSESEEG